MLFSKHEHMENPLHYEPLFSSFFLQYSHHTKYVRTVCRWAICVKIYGMKDSISFPHFIPRPTRIVLFPSVPFSVLMCGLRITHIRQYIKHLSEHIYDRVMGWVTFTNIMQEGTTISMRTRTITNNFHTFSSRSASSSSPSAKSWAYLEKKERSRE